MSKDYSQAVYCYKVVKETYEDVEVIYADSIVNLIGTHGLFLLHINKLIESRGVINNKQVYALLGGKEDE